MFSRILRREGLVKRSEPGLPRWTEAKIGNHVIAVNILPMLRLS